VSSIPKRTKRLIFGVCVAASLALAPGAARAKDYDCSDFQYQEDAQAYLLPGDP
jgi:hypothetical protein